MTSISWKRTMLPAASMPLMWVVALSTVVVANAAAPSSGTQVVARLRVVVKVTVAAVEPSSVGAIVKSRLPSAVPPNSTPSEVATKLVNCTGALLPTGLVRVPDAEASATSSSAAVEPAAHVGVAPAYPSSVHARTPPSASAIAVHTVAPAKKEACVFGGHGVHSPVPAKPTSPIAHTAQFTRPLTTRPVPVAPVPPGHVAHPPPLPSMRGGSSYSPRFALQPSMHAIVALPSRGTPKI
jgi:hypothetical protein